jgi:hypothetical protein
MSKKIKSISNPKLKLEVLTIENELRGNKLSLPKRHIFNVEVSDATETYTPER